MQKRLLIKEDIAWYGRANFGGELFDSFPFICKGCFTGFLVIRYYSG